MNIVIISFCVYIFVNCFENIIHYNIGKFSNKEAILSLPSKKETIFELPNIIDFLKIVIIVCVFALLQGLLTSFLHKYSKK